jgi:hypothetical protein
MRSRVRTKLVALWHSICLYRQAIKHMEEVGPIREDTWVK